MAWWRRIYGHKPAASLDGMEYRVACKLHSQNGEREVEVLMFRNGDAYLLERQRAASGAFEDRHSGRLVGPFPSPGDAERFIGTTDWFNGRDG